MKKNFGLWPIEKARRHARWSGLVVIWTAVISLILGVEDFIALGRNISGFAFPYLYNILFLILAGIQMYNGFQLKKMKRSARFLFFGILLLRLPLGFFDSEEALITMVMLYPGFVLLPGKAGRFFQN